jgi:conjugal transfer pilus assembly protein TraF
VNISARWVMMGFLIFLSTTSEAASFWNTHSAGWHWYQDPKADQPSSEKTQQDPSKQMQSLQISIKRAMDNAILNPTPENIKAYIEIQNRVAAQASVFADVWRRALWTYPQLDYSLAHPTNQTAKHAYLDKERAKMESAIHMLSKTDGLFFFFKGSCPYCHQMAPLVKSFAEHYGFSIIPISMDGDALPEFPNAKLNQSVAAQLHVTAVPALFMVNPNLHRIIPIASGLISADELIQRTYLLTQVSIGQAS